MNTTPSDRPLRIFVVDDPWTIENDLLTPTMKIKRDKLEVRYADMIRQGEGKIVWSEAPA